MEKSRVKIELAEENYGNQDPLAKENTIGTTPNTDILMSTPSIRQMKLTENNVIKTNYRLQESLGVSTDRSILLDSSVLNDFNFEPLDTHHQLEEFDEKLGRDAAFADKMVSWLSRKNEDCDPKTSVVFSLDFLFSRQLFASCSWSGEGRRGPKIPFYKFKNIYKLLRRLAIVKGCSESSGLTRDVLVTKLRVAKSRVACKNDSKGFYTKDTRNGRPNNDAPKGKIAIDTS
ncbi:uncharacterized protein LOC131268438 [Anopheles coustani]|uniref:uncharacterized protein LOC131268438 n=1 Tax=Anopheles coustani TaxID=139045 RepID=UPI002658CA85|nr:uncharacterized protein LOC131268438 [Anopheles coustani]